MNLLGFLFQMEIVDDFEKLNHQLVKEAMRMTGVTKGVKSQLLQIFLAREVD